MRNNPKDTADEIFESYYDVTPLNASFLDTAKQANEKILNDRKLVKECSLICIDEIIKAGNDVISDLMDGYKDQEFNDYWQEVKNEIEKL